MPTKRITSESEVFAELVRVLRREPDRAVWEDLVETGYPGAVVQATEFDLAPEEEMLALVRRYRTLESRFASRTRAQPTVRPALPPDERTYFLATLVAEEVNRDRDVQDVRTLLLGQGRLLNL